MTGGGIVRSTRARVTDVAYAAGLVLGLAILAAFGFFALRERVLAYNDFTYVWAGARVVLEGGDPYQHAPWIAVTRAYGTVQPQSAVFGYGPWVALALVPLAALPVPLASGVWTFGGMAAAALALRGLLRLAAPEVPVVHFLAGLALYASQPGTANAWTGQWGFALTAAMAASVAALLSGRRLGTLAAVPLLGKPHLVALAFPAFARAARARGGTAFVLIFSAPLVATVAIGWLAFPDWFGAWRASVPELLLVAQQPPTTLANAFGDLLGPSGAMVAALALLSLVALALRFDPASDAYLAVWIAVSMTAVIYGWSYDQLVLVVPLVLASGALAKSSPRRATAFAALAFGAFLIVPILLYVIASARQNESFNAFVPLAVAAGCLAVLWPARRAAAPAGEPFAERLAAARIAL